MGGLETGDIYSMVMRRVEKPLISLVLKKTSGNLTHASKLLGMNRNTLRKKNQNLKICMSFDNGEDVKGNEIEPGGAKWNC